MGILIRKAKGNYFQKCYDRIKGIKTPDIIKRLGNNTKLMSLLLKFFKAFIKKVHALDVLRFLYAEVLEVEKKYQIAGYLKKRKVIAGGKKFARALGAEINKGEWDTYVQVIWSWLSWLKKI